jgi:hypothetical protein
MCRDCSENRQPCHTGFVHTRNNGKPLVGEAAASVLIFLQLICDMFKITEGLLMEKIGFIASRMFKLTMKNESRWSISDEDNKEIGLSGNIIEWSVKYIILTLWRCQKVCRSRAGDHNLVEVPTGLQVEGRRPQLGGGAYWFAGRGHAPTTWWRCQKVCRSREGDHNLVEVSKGLQVEGRRPQLGGATYRFEGRGQATTTWWRCLRFAGRGQVPITWWRCLRFRQCLLYKHKRYFKKSCDNCIYLTQMISFH